MKHKKLSARILSLVLTAAMVGTMMPTTLLASEGDTALGTNSTEKITRNITAFNELEGYTKSVPFDGHTYALSVALNTPVEEIKLPTELSVTVERTTTTTPQAKNEVVDSSVVPEEITPDPEQDKETTATETAQETIPVTWKGDKKYNSAENSKMIYTAVMPEGYTLVDGVKLPQIYVIVGKQARAVTLVKRTTPLDLTTARLSYVASDGVTTKTADPTTKSITDTGEGWTWNAETKTLTLNGANINVQGTPMEWIKGINLPGDAIVEVLGINSIQSSGVPYIDRTTSGIPFGIYCVGILTIGGSGTLDVGVTDGAYAYAINTETTETNANHITIRDKVKLNLNVASGTSRGDAISADGDLMITDADISIDSNVYGIESQKSITIKGDCTFDITSNDLGLYALNNITLNDGCTIDINSEGTGMDADGITINGGTLSVSGTDAAVVSCKTSIIADGATVTGATFDNGDEFVSGTTKELKQKDQETPVVISFGPSIAVAAAKKAVEKALGAFNASNATDANAIIALANKAISDASITGVTVSWDGSGAFDKLEATEDATGKVSGTIKLSCGTANATVALNKTIAQLPNDSNEKIATVKAAIEVALNAYTATNDTTNTDIKALVDKVNAESGVKGVNVDWKVGSEFKKVLATDKETGNIAGTITLTLNGKTVDITVDKTIGRFIQQGLTSTGETDKVKVSGMISEYGKLYVELIEAKGGYEDLKAKVDTTKNEVIGAFEARIIGGTYDGKLIISFGIGEKYDGKTITIYHQKADGTFETFTTVCKNGEAVITVDELSPFVLSVPKDASNPGGITKVPGTPTTGDTRNLMLLLTLLLVSSGACTALFVRRRKVSR